MCEAAFVPDHAGNERGKLVYGDVLTIDTRISEMSGVRINFEYDIKNQNGKLISKAKTIVACVDDNFKPKPIPEEIRKKIKK